MRGALRGAVVPALVLALAPLAAAAPAAHDAVGHAADADPLRGAAPAWVATASDALVLFGCVFLLAAALGVLRFPDFYTRLHASTKLVTLGGIGIFGGAALVLAPEGAAPRLLLTAVFFFLTAPLSGYMIARAGYLRGLRPYTESTSVDEWGACGVEESDEEPPGAIPNGPSGAGS